MMIIKSCAAECGVIPQHIFESRKLALVHVGCGECHVAQAGRLELACGLGRAGQYLEALGPLASAIIAELTQRVERIGPQQSNAIKAARIAQAAARGYADIVKLTIAEHRPAM